MSELAPTLLPLTSWQFLGADGGDHDAILPAAVALTALLGKEQIRFTQAYNLTLPPAFSSKNVAAEQATKKHFHSIVNIRPLSGKTRMVYSSGFHPFNGQVSKHFRMLNPDDPYLSYHDIRLTKEDVDTLKDDWLTDNVIAFWEEYLEREYLIQYKNAHIVLLRPSMSFMLIQTDNPLTLKDALPNFNRISHIFLPLNDNRNPSIAEGGSHWSLLLVSVVDSVAFHYDSLSPSNKEEAVLATKKISELLGRPFRFMDLGESPQQENSSDCGVFVCVQMRHLLLRRLLAVDSSLKVSMSMGGKSIDARAGRKEMLKVIEKFRKEGERRRSYVLLFALPPLPIFSVHAVEPFWLTDPGEARVQARIIPKARQE